MKILTPFLVLFGVAITTHQTNAQGTMRVDGATARIVASGNPSIVLSDMHFQNNASNTMFTAASSEVRFLGNTTNVSSTGPFNTTFANVEINKNAGQEIDVITNNMTLTVSAQLEMVQGNIDMNNNLGSTVELGTSTAVLGNLLRTSGHLYRGYFRRWYAAGAGLNTAPWDVPIGMNGGTYNYARVYYVNATTGGTLRVRFVPVNPFYTGLPLVDATDLVSCPGAVNVNNCANEGYWEIIAANGIDVTSPYTIKLNYTNFTAPTSEQCLRVIKSENLVSWMQEGVHGTFNGAQDWVTRDGQTGFPSGTGSSLFTIAGDVLVNPLPIELASFNTHCTSNNSILVNWTTTSESGNSYFVLERSRDLISWDIVTMVNSLNGNSNQTQQYSYEDHSYGGTFYYRLNQVDINGAPTTFPPVTVTCNGTGGEPTIVNAYQNGGEQQVTVVLFSPTESDFVLSLYNLHGQKIYASQGMLAGGNNTITLDAFVLRDAYYLIHIQVGDKNLSRKIFVK